MVSERAWLIGILEDAGMTDPADRGGVSALAKKWRAKANEKINPGGGMFQYSERTIATLRNCADELEAALQGSGAPPQEAQPLREFAEYVEKAPERAIEVLRREKYVFNRFPRNMEKEPPVGDGERWEALAFHLYSRLGELSSMAIRALNAADELEAALQGSGAPPQEWKTAAIELAKRVTCQELHDGVLCRECSREDYGCLRAWIKCGELPSPGGGRLRSAGSLGGEARSAPPPDIVALDCTELVQRGGWDCAKCGHRHAGRELANICIGCSCPEVAPSEVGSAERTQGTGPEHEMRKKI